MKFARDLGLPRCCARWLYWWMSRFEIPTREKFSQIVVFAEIVEVERKFIIIKATMFNRLELSCRRRAAQRKTQRSNNNACDAITKATNAHDRPKHARDRNFIRP